MVRVLVQAAKITREEDLGDEAHQRRLIDGAAAMAALFTGMWGKVEIGGARCVSVGKVLAGRKKVSVRTRFADRLRKWGGEASWHRRARSRGNGGQRE